jgi:hypothetical protein
MRHEVQIINLDEGVYEVIAKYDKSYYISVQREERENHQGVYEVIAKYDKSYYKERKEKIKEVINDNGCPRRENWTRSL